MLGRLKFDIDTLVNEILDNISEDMFKSSTTTFLDPAMGGGQFLKNVILKLRKYGHSDDNISVRVFGYESNKMRVNFAAKQCNNIGTFVAKDFLEEDMSKKFDVIVGNPPYQAAVEVENSKKLYIDIGKKSINLLKDGGYLAFVTPQSILIPSRLNTLYSDFNGKLDYVDFTANEHFNVGQSIIAWIYCNNFDANRKITVKDKTVRQVDSIELVSSDENKILKQILNKVDYSLNGMPKLEILQAQDKKYVPKDKLSTEKLEGYVEVVCSGTQRIKYCDPLYSYDPGNQLVIPFVGNWKLGTEITNKPTNKELFVTKKELNLDELKSLKSMMDSKLIEFCVTNYKKIKPSMGFVFLRKLPYIGYHTIWTDQELYAHFGLTQEEIDYIEANVK